MQWWGDMGEGSVMMAERVAGSGFHGVGIGWRVVSSGSTSESDDLQTDIEVLVVGAGWRVAGGG